MLNCFNEMACMHRMHAYIYRRFKYTCLYFVITLISANHRAFPSISAQVFIMKNPQKYRETPKKISRYLKNIAIYRISRYIAAALMYTKMAVAFTIHCNQQIPCCKPRDVFNFRYSKKGSKRSYN